MDRKKQKLIIPAVMALVVGLSCQMPLQATPPGPQPSIKDLLVEDDAVPEAWYIFDREEEKVQGGPRHSVTISRGFSPKEDVPGIAFQEAYYFSTIVKAERAFSEWRETHFRPASPDAVAQPRTDWEVPTTIAVDSLADEYYLACNIHVISQCEILMRYRNYVIVFYAHRWTEDYPSGMTDSEIEQMLIGIDSRAAQELELCTPASSP